MWKQLQNPAVKTMIHNLKKTKDGGNDHFVQTIPLD